MFASHLEQVLAVLLAAFLMGDTIVRMDMMILSLRKKEPIQLYFQGWLSEKIFKDWYMFLRWDRVILAMVIGVTLVIIDFKLLMLIMAIKIILDFLFHKILSFYSNKFFNR